jgi:hypothetical protein
VTRSLALLGGTVALVLLAPAPAAADAAPAKGLRWYAIPNAFWDADDGLGVGARAEVAVDEPGYDPYKMAFVVHAILSTRGYHHHRFRFDHTGLGPDGRFRVTLHVAWRQWLNDGYWGLGNFSARENDAAGKRYRYSLFQPFAHLTVRAKLEGPWQAFASLNAKWSEIRTYDGSLLAEQRPYGMDGGLGMIVSAGFLYDTRKPELTPDEGLLVEFSARAGLPMPAGAGTFGGPFLSMRVFRSLAPWCVFAARGMIEYLFGDVPFYEMVHWGGAFPIAGFGGADTLRGVPFGRWHGPGKAVLNAELRFDIGRNLLAGRRLQWQAVPFFDSGIVFGQGETTDNPRGGWPIHPTGGAGIRAVYAKAFVGRVDVGFGADPRAEPDGTVVHDLSWGLYVVFDHTF